jgi:hypothetical protein
MNHERSIWDAAAYLVMKHGDAAVRVAEQQAARFGDLDDDAGFRLWLQVMEAAAELIRSPQQHERAN